MEQDRRGILDRSETKKMCSLNGNEAGEMCSPADADTYGKYCKISAEMSNRKSKSDAYVKFSLDMEDYYRIKDGKELKSKEDKYRIII